MTIKLKRSVFLALVLTFLVGCSSPQPVKTQAYAKLSHQRVFEYDFPKVWKGIEEALRNHKILDRDPKEVNPLELKKLTERTLETDWVYGQSRDKYHEYQVNGSPRKVYLQSRFKYFIEAKSQIGGVKVSIKTHEEIEELNADGTPSGYVEMKEPDPSRPSDLIDKIGLSILSAPPSP